jgi:hypothetical protein
VFGSYAIFSDHRAHEVLKWQFVAILTLGVALLVLAFLGEKRGRRRKVVIVVRNTLVALCVVVIFLATLIVLLGPLH